MAYNIGDSNNIKGGHHVYGSTSSLTQIPTTLKSSGMEVVTTSAISFDSSYNNPSAISVDIAIIDDVAYSFYRASTNTVLISNAITGATLSNVSVESATLGVRYLGHTEDKVIFSSDETGVYYIDRNTYTLSSRITWGFTAVPNSKIYNNILHLGFSGTFYIIDLNTWSIITTWSVTNNGSDIAFNEKKLYITDGSSSISVYNLLDYTYITTISSVGTTPRPISTIGKSIFGYINSKLFILCTGSNEIKVIDCQTDTILTSISLGADAYKGSIVNDKLYVLCYSSNVVKVIDINTYEIVSTISLSPLTAPQAGGNNMLYYQNRLFICSQGSGASTGGLTVINTLTNTKILTLNGYQLRAAMINSRSMLYVSGLDTYVRKYQYTPQEVYVLQPDLTSWSKETPLIRYGDTITNAMAYEDNEIISNQITDNVLMSRGLVRDFLDDIYVTENNSYRDITTITSTYSVTDFDYMININATSNNINVILPPARGRKKKEYTFLRVDASVNTVIVSATASDLINGVATQSIAPSYDGFTIKGDGDNWFIKK